MTLGRQLLALILLLFVVAFAGTFFIALHNTRAYLVAQLESHAQDAATSLGLSLSPHLAAGDRALMESMIDAVFDRGYYRDIELVDLEGRPLVRRAQGLTADRVPGWFVARLPLVTPTAEAVVMAGWRQGGWVRVTSHPGYAYAELWASARDTLGWALGSLLLAVLALGALLRLLLRPLRALERQALAVARREFPVLEPLPRTRELRRVVVAMNDMTRRIRQVLEEQTATAERLRAEAYTDSVTGAGNRRSFEGRLLALTDTGEGPGFGVLMLARLGGLEQVNRLNGHAAGDELLRSAARRLEGLVDDPRAPFVARLQGAEFGVILPAVTAVEARGLAAAMVDALATLSPSEGLTVHVGVAYAAAGDAPAEVLACSDAALRAAEGAGTRAWREYTAVAAYPPIQGLEAWRSVLARAIEGGGLALVGMPVRACRDGALLQSEVLARLTLPGQEPIPAALFVPMAERLGLGARLDRAVAAQALQRLDQEAGERALNLCLASLRDAELLEWLQRHLATAPGVASRLVFEVSEHVATRALDAWRAFIDRFAGSGVRFAVDRFGMGASILGHLRGLRLDYLKLDPALVRQLADGRDEQFFVKLVCDIAHALDMKVVATGVETPEQWQRLCALGVDGGAGTYLGEPGGSTP